MRVCSDYLMSALRMQRVLVHGISLENLPLRCLFDVVL